jgi:hypothetical protein
MGTGAWKEDVNDQEGAYFGSWEDWSAGRCGGHIRCSIAIGTGSGVALDDAGGAHGATAHAGKGAPSSQHTGNGGTPTAQHDDACADNPRADDGSTSQHGSCDDATCADQARSGDD